MAPAESRNIAMDPKPDTGKPDTGKPDTGKPDTGKPDSRKADTGKPDDRKADTGKPDRGGDDRPKEFQDDETSRLVDRAHEGDVSALNDLFQRYHHVMVEVARRKLGPRLRLKEDPDDLAQTTFREATRDFQHYRYQGEGSLLRWLIQILQNKIRDKAEFYSAGKRDLSRERTMEAPEGDDSSSGAGMDFSSADMTVTQMVSREENFEILHESLEDLSDEHRLAITLVFFEGCSLRQAGERMGGKSEDAVRMMLRRAEAKLGDRLRASLGRDLK